MKHLHLLPFLLLAGCSSNQPTTTTVAVAPPAQAVAPQPVVAAPQAASNAGSPATLGVAPPASSTPVADANSATGDNAASAPSAPVGNPFHFDVNSMPSSIDSALAAVDRTNTPAETLALLPYLSEARRDFADKEQQCGFSNRQCVIVYSLSEDAISAVRDYAQTKANGQSGTTILVAARNGMGISARIARNKASLVSDNLTGVAQQRSQESINSMRNMMQNDSNRLRGR